MSSPAAVLRILKKQGVAIMPTVSIFKGIIVRMPFDEHALPQLPTS
jgi:hypothetical protein